jgi:hypothetical protein
MRFLRQYVKSDVMYLAAIEQYTVDWLKFGLQVEVF